MLRGESRRSSACRYLLWVSTGVILCCAARTPVQLVDRTVAVPEGIQNQILLHIDICRIVSVNRHVSARYSLSVCGFFRSRVAPTP